MGFWILFSRKEGVGNWLLFCTEILRWQLWKMTKFTFTIVETLGGEWKEPNPKTKCRHFHLASLMLCYFNNWFGAISKCDHAHVTNKGKGQVSMPSFKKHSHSWFRVWKLWKIVTLINPFLNLKKLYTIYSTPKKI